MTTETAAADGAPPRAATEAVRAAADLAARLNQSDEPAS